MRDELEMKIAEKFPFMRRGKHFGEQREEGRIHDLYGAFGCSVRDGWYEVIRGLCRDITEAYEKAGRPIDIVVDQVKEKFGTLRFYYHFEGQGPGINLDRFKNTPRCEKYRKASSKYFSFSVSPAQKV